MDFAIGLLQKHNPKIERLKPSEYQEKYRDMTGLSSLPGKYSYKNSPYVREIVDRFDPDDPTRKITVMKVPQSGLSAGVVEGVFLWTIAQSPCPMMILSGDPSLSKDMVEKRIDLSIDSCGLRDYIRPTSNRKRNQRTGDTSNSKEFPGGWCVFDGPNNPNNYRQRSIMRGIFDDLDAAKMEDKSEGSLYALFEMRFTWYANEMKLGAISTPTIKGQSNIEEVHNRSDKREYNMPCPNCGSFIVLEFKIDKNEERFGLIFKVDRFNKLVEKSVEYRCQSCGEHFKEAGNKYTMLNNGIWVPTNEEHAEPYHAGYHIGGLMLPPNTLTWNDQVKHFLKCYPQGLDQPPYVPNLKVFVNQVLGDVYEEKGESLKSNQLQKNCRLYDVGTIPAQQSRDDGNGEIVLITFACDVNGKLDDVRIDWEIVAHSEKKTTYSINHGSEGTFQRKLDREGRKRLSLLNNAENSVWPYILSILQEKIPTDDGNFMNIQFAGFDEGFGDTFIHTFIETLPPKIAVSLKGINTKKALKADQDKKYTKPSTTYHRRHLVEVNTVKDDLYHYMNFLWDKSKEQEEHFMNFPKPTKDKYTYDAYFVEFEGEERKADINDRTKEVTILWEKITDSSRNHFWDVRVYGEALAQLACFNVCKEFGVDVSWINFCLIMKNI